MSAQRKTPALRAAEARLVELLKRALNYIDAQNPGPGHDLAAWAAIHDDLLAEIQMYEPTWSPGDDEGATS